MLNLIQNKAWALHPAKLQEIEIFITTRLEGKENDFQIVKPVKNGLKSEENYTVTENGTAIIPIFGTISKRANMLDDFSGGTSAEILRLKIQSALDNPKVSSIFLDIDSPGGTVEGTKELSDFIFENRGKKPITAFTDGMIASAAYWIGSAADKIVATDTAIIGSIGVAMTHYDVSGKDAQKGVVRTQISAGKYKRIASDEKPLSDEGREYLQSMVDTYYSMFVEGVARNRGVSVENALQMADGKDFIGKKALLIGLVDSISARESALENLHIRSVTKMDYKTLKEKHPDLFAQILEEGKQSNASSIEKAKEDATKAERERVTEILSAEGDKDATVEAIIKGTSASDVFKTFFQIEKQKKVDGLQAMASSAPVSVGRQTPGDSGNEKNFMSEVEKLVAQGKSKADAVREIAKSFPDLHAKYVENLKKEKGA